MSVAAYEPCLKIENPDDKKYGVISYDSTNDQFKLKTNSGTGDPVLIKGNGTITAANVKSDNETRLSAVETEKQDKLTQNKEYIFIGPRIQTWSYSSGDNRYKKVNLGYFQYKTPSYTITPGFIKAAVVGTGYGVYKVSEYLLFYSTSGTGNAAYLQRYTTYGTSYANGTFDMILEHNAAAGWSLLKLYADNYSDIDGIGCYMTATIPNDFKLYEDTALTIETPKEKILTWYYSGSPN